MSTPLETLATPLCFPVDDPTLTAPDGPYEREQTGRFRSLSVMQKEALITSGSGRTWRLVSDEGPDLDGADVAPPPLAFLSAGVVSAIMTELRRHGAERGVDVDGVELAYDTIYSVKGSALRGTMTGTAHRPRVTALVGPDADEGVIEDLLTEAVERSPVAALHERAHDSAFAMAHNGEPLAVDGVAPLDGDLPPDPTSAFETEPVPAGADDHQPLVERTGEKTEAFPEADDSYTDEDAEGYAAEQDRTIHLRGHCTVDEEGLIHVEQMLYSPRGTVFRFTADEPDGERAPDALTLVAAGIGFCFMTQLGRYAEVLGEELTSYRLHQETGFTGGEDGAAMPVEVSVWLDTPADATFARDALRKAEQTCYLHALCRTPDLLPEVAVSRR